MEKHNPVLTARWIAFLVPFGLIAGALGSQFIGGLKPCEMCEWQRWPHYAAIAVAGASFFIQHRFTRALFVAFAGILIAVSGAIGLFHAGVEYGWWQGITPCTAEISANASAEEMLAQINRGSLVRCDEPQWTFLLSLAGWNAVISFAAAIAIFSLVGRRRSA